jgi:hypothetical protein
VDRRTVAERADAAGQAVAVDVHDQRQAELLHPPIAKGDHLAELPGRVDVQQGEGRLGRMEGLHREMKQHRGVLADRVEDDRFAEHRGGLAQGMDGLGFERLQMVIGDWQVGCSSSLGEGMSARRRRSLLPW